jgi:transcription-repair coupling factor (superfamily II helicase)
MISLADSKKLFNFPDISRDVSHIYNLAGSSAALFLSLQREPFVAVEQTEDEAFRLFEDIRFFTDVAGGTLGNISFLPEPNGPESSGKRAEIVQRVTQGGAVVTSKNGKNSLLWLPDDLKRDSFYLTAGGEKDRDELEKNLRSLGYRRVSVVMEKGEYCAKGWLVDIFPSTSEFPARAEFFGDEIEQIKSFDVGSQRSLGRIDSLLIMPAKEPSSGAVISSLVKGRIFLVDAPEDEPTDNAVLLSRFDIRGEGHNAGSLSMRGLGVYPDERKSLYEFVASLKSVLRDNRVLIVSSSEGQAERVKDILFDGGIIAPVIGKGDLLRYEGAVAITKGSLSCGLFSPGLMILTEKEIFGERPHYRAIKKSKVSELLTSMDDIAPGDFVVHRDHGIGRFSGIIKEMFGDFESDLIALEYAGGDKLYIPLYNIDRIKKYSAEQGAVPVLDRLGGKTWQRRKERVKKAVREMAERLLKLYAERSVAESFSFSGDTELHREFYDFFPYEETPDQVKTFEEISRDMEAERPMDRLLCGDVGYGKTEVAMRAAFKAAYDGRQVAVLVPTTILCEQHYLTFKDRFSAFPVKIDYLSRFKPKRERDLTLKAAARGEVDIVIGTHGLLGKGVSFANLGLLIIDEEHRFGVGQKERIKELKKGIDVLSMTATPIPRTLHMALSGIRGMSVIETPPEERLAVRSVVAVFDEELIREAVERELHRGGQVLFVHNSVFDIERFSERFEKMMPHVRFGIAHGQMAERKLEEVMIKFIRGGIDVLVSTTIIGSGIDIPTANTIIIDRADKIGLSDLYQLRGRVGRSNVRAYAYFLIPGRDIVGEEAKKRLQAISEMSFLGAGFRLAMKDLEMRGAGNLLGSEQSGHVHAVGFDMYVEMLEKAVAELKGAGHKDEAEPSVSLRVSALIPDSYVEDMTLRLSIYRRVANAKSVEDLDDMESEMADRFGALPGETRRLLDVMKLKVMAKRLSILGIYETERGVRFVFSQSTPVAADRLLALHETFHGIRFHKDGFEVNLTAFPKDEAYREAFRVLDSLSS